MSELDKTRQQRLLKYIDGVQTIITCTHADNEVFDGVEYKKFLVDGGKIAK